MTEQKKTIEAVEVPAEMIASCPKERGAMVRVRACFDCPEFGGAIGVLNPDPRIPWEARHVVICRFRRHVEIRRLKEG